MTHVPKFGEWEAEEDVPYTDFFDNARTKKKLVKINTNNHQKIGNTFMDNVPPLQATPFQTETQSGAQNGQERSSSLVDGDLRRAPDSPWHQDTGNLKDSTESPLHQHDSVNAIGIPKRATKQSVGSDPRTEDSPLHSHHLTKVGGNGSGIPLPSWERRVSTERGNNLVHLTPGRSRLRSVAQVTEPPDQHAAVPKFGEWDESDPTTADGFSHIFNKVRKEKMNGTGNVSAAAFGKPYSKNQKQHENEKSKKFCCFPW